MYSLLLINLLLIRFSSIASQDEDIKVKSLCEDPLIHSADRLVNQTVRVYRGKYYWELSGLPSETATVNGPYKIWNLNMGTFNINNALVTILEGTDIGSIYKTQGQRYWAWDKDGKQFAGAVRGNFWDLLPVGGFEAAFHNGNKNNPTVIGFKGIYVYYFSTKDKIWTGDKKGHINGKYDENFPSDLTAAFSWPADDPKDEYIAYLFKRKKYCKRTKLLKDGQNCQWIDNRVLFGCPNVRVEDVIDVTDQKIQTTQTISDESPVQSTESMPVSQEKSSTATNAVATEDNPPINSKKIYSSDISLIFMFIYLFIKLV